MTITPARSGATASSYKVRSRTVVQRQLGTIHPDRRTFNKQLLALVTGAGLLPAKAAQAGLVAFPASQLNNTYYLVGRPLLAYKLVT